MAASSNHRFSDQSLRAQWWDYQRAGAYFVTICTRHRVAYFGQVEEGIMHLSPTGVLADVFWHQIPLHASAVNLGPFVVMPDHIHGIVLLGSGGSGESSVGSSVGSVGSLYTTIPHQVPQDQPDSQIPQDQPDPQDPQDQDQTASSPPATGGKNQEMAQKSPKKNSLSVVIRNYKGAVTRHARRLGLPHGWQSRFHDRIIRNEEAYLRISRYIRDNPKNWGRK